MTKQTLERPSGIGWWWWRAHMHDPWVALQVIMDPSKGELLVGSSEEHLCQSQWHGEWWPVPLTQPELTIEETPMRPKDTRHLSPKQLAQALGVSPSVITRWHQTGVIIPTIKEGNVIRFDLEEVEAGLAKRAKKRGKEK